MGVINRELDTSEQRHVLTAITGTALTGSTNLPLFVIPFNCFCVGGQIAVSGMSGAPTIQLQGVRTFAAPGSVAYGAGSGATNFNIGSTLLLTQNWYTTGATSLTGCTLPVFTGASMVTLLAGDLIGANMGGGNAGLYAGCVISLVIQAIQDIRNTLGT